MALQDRSDRIDHVGPDLVWRQLAEDVESDIAAGVLAPNAKMPTELELASQYGVSRVTVRRAVKDLAERGLLVVVHGRGTFVSRASAPGAPGTSA